MRALVVLSLLSAASAFVTPAPRAPTRARGSAMMSVREMIGIDVETGGLFDPLNFSKDEDKLYQYRCAELKHGRLAMVAVAGIIHQNFATWTDVFGDQTFSEHAPLAAFSKLLSERPLAVVQILLFLTGLELTDGKQDPEKAPGEIGRFGEAFKPEGEEELRKLQLKELKNGRLAMVGVLGLLAQEAVTGKNPIGQLFDGSSLPF